MRVCDYPPASWDRGTWLSRCPSCATLTIPVVGRQGRQRSQVFAFPQSTRSPRRRNRRRRGEGGGGERGPGNATSQHQSGVFPEIHLFLKDTGGWHDQRNEQLAADNRNATRVCVSYTTAALRHLSLQNKRCCPHLDIVSLSLPQLAIDISPRLA